MMVEHLHKILVREGLDRWAWPLAESSQPAIKIRTVFSDEKLIPIGVSKFGGTPHVPMNFRWPTTPEGNPLAFIAQINFGEFLPFQWMGWNVPLPGEGLISLFTDWPGSTAWQVFFFDQPKGLVRWEDPYAVDSPARRLDRAGLHRVDLQSRAFPPRSLAFDQFLSLPTECGRARTMGQTDEEATQFLQFTRRHNGQAGRHQILGYPAFSPIPSEDETLLLQLDSDPLVEWNWPGTGVVSLVVPTEDLMACVFHRVQAIRQYT